jgi:hypothetical protein
MTVEAEAARREVERSDRVLAVNVLEQYLRVFHGTAAFYQPGPPSRPNANADPVAFEKWARLAIRVCELLGPYQTARASGGAPSLTQVNTMVFVNSPVFAELQTMLVEKLRGHPEALRAVVDGLRELESRSEGAPTTMPVIEHHGNGHAG